MEVGRHFRPLLGPDALAPLLGQVAAHAQPPRTGHHSQPGHDAGGGEEALAEGGEGVGRGQERTHAAHHQGHAYHHPGQRRPPALDFDRGRDASDHPLQRGPVVGARLAPDDGQADAGQEHRPHHRVAEPQSRLPQEQEHSEHHRHHGQDLGRVVALVAHGRLGQRLVGALLGEDQPPHDVEEGAAAAGGHQGDHQDADDDRVEAVGPGHPRADAAEHPPLAGAGDLGPASRALLLASGSLTCTDDPMTVWRRLRESPRGGGRGRVRVGSGSSRMVGGRRSAHAAFHGHSTRNPTPRRTASAGVPSPTGGTHPGHRRHGDLRPLRGPGPPLRGRPPRLPDRLRGDVAGRGDRESCSIWWDGRWCPTTRASRSGPAGCRARTRPAATSCWPRPWPASGCSC